MAEYVFFFLTQASGPMWSTGALLFVVGQRPRLMGASTGHLLALSSQQSEVDRVVTHTWLLKSLPGNACISLAKASHKAALKFKRVRKLSAKESGRNVC